jgi:CubicO group peptidase (beta-lactamase class C family)
VRAPNSSAPARAPAHPPTIRELLSNSAGLVMWTPEERGALDLHPLSRLVQFYAATELRFEPGAGYSYSNAGFNTAGRVIEIVSGMGYADFVQKRLLDPLGMTDTTFWPDDAQLARLASAYKSGPDGLARVEKIGLLNHPLGDRARRHALPAGGLFSTAADTARFGRLLLNKGVFDGKRILSEAAVAEMTRRQTAEGAVRTPYGFGLNTVKGACWHGGAYGTELCFWPERNTVSVLMVQKDGRAWGSPAGEKIPQLLHQKALELAQNTKN